MNKVILIGRLTKDVDIRYTEAGKAVANFTLAVDRPFKNQQGEKEADFIRIVVWGKQAENCANYIGKGRLVAVDGRLQIRSYEGQDGDRKYITEVVAETVKFLDKPKEETDPVFEFDGSDYQGMEAPF
jgi:single-strand DNA-binding protein